MAFFKYCVDKDFNLKNVINGIDTFRLLLIASSLNPNFVKEEARNVPERVLKRDA